jgi:hypothetical protein
MSIAMSVGMSVGMSVAMSIAMSTIIITITITITAIQCTIWGSTITWGNLEDSTVFEIRRIPREGHEHHRHQTPKEFGRTCQSVLSALIFGRGSVNAEALLLLF